MSRKGNTPITLLKGVEVKIADSVVDPTASTVTVSNGSGKLTQEIISKLIKFETKDNQGVKELHVELVDSSEESEKLNGKFHGLYRALIANMIEGLTKGFEKKLTLVGVGYKVALTGKSLTLQVGFSHPVIFPIPLGLTAKVEGTTIIAITGADRQAVGQFAAAIRAMRPPEPYKGKGILYGDVTSGLEHIRRKAGKAAAKK